MAEVCPVCGLPKDICVCKEIAKEQQRIRVRLEKRKWGRAMTIIDGLDDGCTDLNELAKKLKTICACGGMVMLQGDQREKVKELLIELGYPEENIEVQ